MKPRKSKLKIRNIHEGNPVRIVADGALAARGVNDGKIHPVLILDTSDRPDIEEFIRAHESASNLGDFTMQWGQLEGHAGTVALFLTFIRPVEVVVILEFDITEEGIIVDQALLGKGLYIQAGREGDSFRENIDRPKVMLILASPIFKRHGINYGASIFKKTYAGKDLLNQLRGVELKMLSKRCGNLEIYDYMVQPEYLDSIYYQPRARSQDESRI